MCDVQDGHRCGTFGILAERVLATPLERQILAWIFALSMLRNHERQREIVHSQRNVEQLIGIGEEDDVFERLPRLSPNPRL